MRAVAVTEGKIADVLVSLGRVEEAMRLYEKSLKTIAGLGDVRAVAVTEGKIADVLVSLGRVEEAMRLYEKSLKTKEGLGDVREVAVTEASIADVLVRLGRVDEAMRLYEKSLKTIAGLGDVRAVAVTRANRGQGLLMHGERVKGLHDLWAAYLAVKDRYPPETQTLQHLLQQARAMLGADPFDAVWAQATSDPQPAWLHEVAAPTEDEGADAQLRLSSQQLDAIVHNTAAVLTFANDKLAEWCEAIHNAAQQARQLGDASMISFFEAILALLDGRPAALPADHAYAEAWQRIHSEIERHQGDSTPDDAGAAEAEAETAPELPIEPALIQHTIAALRGSPDDRMAQAGRLQAALQAATDPEAQAFIRAMQMALFGGDLRALKSNLGGTYAELWEALIFNVIAGEQAGLLMTLVNNTRAVLGPAASQKAEWRANLIALREQVLQAKDNDLLAFIEALIRLLDADGRAAGLGVGLRGVYADLWRQLV